MTVQVYWELNVSMQQQKLHTCTMWWACLLGSFRGGASASGTGGIGGGGAANGNGALSSGMKKDCQKLVFNNTRTDFIYFWIVTHWQIVFQNWTSIHLHCQATNDCHALNSQCVTPNVSGWGLRSSFLQETVLLVRLTVQEGAPAQVILVTAIQAATATRALRISSQALPIRGKLSAQTKNWHTDIRVTSSHQLCHGAEYLRNSH